MSLNRHHMRYISMLCDRDSNLAVVEVSVVLHRKRQQFQGYYRKAIINYIGRPDDINRCIG